VKLRASITIDIDAPDFVTAAEHQRRMEELIAQTRAVYPQASLELRQGRIVSSGRGAPRTPSVAHATGRLNQYEDLPLVRPAA
jgi:hypothetical protein